MTFPDPVPDETVGSVSPEGIASVPRPETAKGSPDDPAAPSGEQSCEAEVEAAKDVIVGEFEELWASCVATDPRAPGRFEPLEEIARNAAEDIVAALRASEKPGLTADAVALTLVYDGLDDDSLAVPQGVWDRLTERGLIVHGRDHTGEGYTRITGTGVEALRTLAQEPDPSAGQEETR